VFTEKRHRVCFFQKRTHGKRRTGEVIINRVHLSDFPHPVFQQILKGFIEKEGFAAIE
jgi:hypothetical protein